MTHKDFFFKILDLLDHNRISYWLMCGTLLGAVREKDFLPGDFCDTDIAIDAKDYWKVRYLLNNEHYKHKFLKYDYIRRRELSVKDLKDRYKVDIFAMEHENDNYYIYSYRQNPETKRWDKEWRAFFPYNLFFPLKKYMFLGRKIYIPNEYQQILEIHYGKDWNIPNPNWVSNDPLNRDFSYNEYYPAGISPLKLDFTPKQYDFAFLCVNLLRPQETKKCIESFKQQYPKAKVYVADQDIPSGEMIQFYEEHNVEYWFVPFDSGLSYCRNLLIDNIKEDYILWGDNDFIFDERSNIYKGIELLKNKEELGVVGGMVLKNEVELHYERILLIDEKRGILVYIPLEHTNPEAQTINEIKYFDCDLTFNYAIAKKEVFNNKKVRWNPKIKVRYEHSCFFLKLKKFSKFKVAYCPDMKVIHKHIVKKDEYSELRWRKEDGCAFAEDWQLRMNFTIGQGREIYKKQEVTQETQLPKFTEPIKKPTSTHITNLENIICLFENLNINYALAKGTCLSAVKQQPILGQDLYLFVDLTDSHIYELKRRGFIYENNCLIYNSLHTHIIKGLPRKTKTIQYNSKTYIVPFPVVNYLKSEFGNNWEHYNA